MNEIKMTEDEINEIRGLQEKLQEKRFQFGNLYIEKIQIDDYIKAISEKEIAIQEDFKNLQKMESDLIEKILKKYGEGNLDLKAGVFIPEKSK